MKLKAKLALLSLGACMIAWAVGDCAQRLGDFLGDQLWLRAID